MTNTSNNIKFLIYTSLIAALYTALTLAIPFLGYGPIQFRVSEALILLAFIEKKYLPGLVLGCFLANVLGSPFGPIDWILGTLATFIAVYLITKTNNLFIATLWPVITNAIIIGGELYYLGEVTQINLPIHPFIATAGSVALGEFIAVSVIGYIIFNSINKSETIKNLLKLKIS